MNGSPVGVAMSCWTSPEVKANVTITSNPMMAFGATLHMIARGSTMLLSSISSAVDPESQYESAEKWDMLQNLHMWTEQS
jgi:hypothetical protein